VHIEENSVIALQQHINKLW